MQKVKKTGIALVLVISLFSQVNVAQAQAAKVYVAPYSGVKYHSYRYCRGLSRARSVKKMAKKKARRLGYTKCKLC